MIDMQKTDIPAGEILSRVARTNDYSLTERWLSGACWDSSLYTYRIADSGGNRGAVAIDWERHSLSRGGYYQVGKRHPW